MHAYPVVTIQAEDADTAPSVFAELPSLLAPQLVALLKSTPTAQRAVSTLSPAAAPAGSLLADGMSSVWLPHLGGGPALRELLEALLEQSVALQQPPGAGGSAGAGASSATHLMLVREAVASVVFALAAAAPAVFLSTLRGRLPAAPATSPSHLTALMALIRVVQVCTRLFSTQAFAPSLRRRTRFLVEAKFRT
jgi:hypothetical protein